jgi:hypothetical protein
MNRLSSLVNNFLNCFVVTVRVQLRVRWVTTSTPTAPLPFFSRAAFPVARKRRDSMQLTQCKGFRENILKKPRTLPRGLN